MANTKSKALVPERSQAASYEMPFVQQGDHILISAHLLHKQLKVKSLFANWIKRRIEEYNFTENEDFFPNMEKSSGGRRVKDYLLTLDTAKELAMVERNEVGRTIRRYFIAKEKELRGVSQLPQERSLFKGLRAKRINDRKMYPYREVLRRLGYSPNGSSRKNRYWMHFIKEGTVNYITQEFAIHLYHSKRVYDNRKVMINSQPVLPFGFGDTSLLKSSSHVS